MRHSLSVLPSIVIAAFGVAGLVFVATTAGTGTAPDSGQRYFDSPGCLPISYAGPGQHGHYLRNRNCPMPKPVILRSVSPASGGWRVTWDATRSYDPKGGRVVAYAWSVDGGAQRPGRRISVRFQRPGSHSVTLYVTDDSGLTWTAAEDLHVP